MKYSIMGFNQALVVQYEVDGLKCDLTDLTLLNYIAYAGANPNMKYVTDEEEHSYVWLSHQHILEDLPILNLAEGALRNRITKLKKMELITSKIVSDISGRGSRAYYRLTDNAHEMLYSNDTTTSFKNDTVTRPRHFKMTSDNKQIVDKEVDITVTNVTVTPQAATTPKHSRLIPTISNDDAITEKPKKKGNLYTKCLDMIESFTDNEMVRDDLRDYLKLLLEMKNNGDLQRFYANSFKGMLNNLADIATDPEDQHIVIRCSIDRGYKKFIPLEDAKRYKSGKFVSSRNSMAVPTESGERYVPYMTEEDYEKESDWIKEMEARGKQVRF